MSVLRETEIKGMGSLILRRTVSGQYLVYFIAENLDVGTCDYYLGDSEIEAIEIFEFETKAYRSLERKVKAYRPIRKGV